LKNFRPFPLSEVSLKSGILKMAKICMMRMAETIAPNKTRTEARIFLVFLASARMLSEALEISSEVLLCSENWLKLIHKCSHLGPKL